MTSNLRTPLMCAVSPAPGRAAMLRKSRLLGIGRASSRLGCALPDRAVGKGLRVDLP
jgi:hypothetical protein